MSKHYLSSWDWPTQSATIAIANINQTIAEIRETLLEVLDTATLTPLGEGGFGTTQLAKFPTGAQCVLKTIAKHAPAQATAIFQAEIETIKGLDHPHIPKFLGTGQTPEGQPYILQQYIPGQNLEQILKAEGAWELDKVKEMVWANASILVYLHDKGLAHRDIKPQNILRNQDGYYLVDFGSSKVVDDRTGTVIGSFAYSAPEQVMGKACARSDIYSLGMTAVHLLTGLNERELIDPATDKWLWLEIYDKRWSDRSFRDLLQSMLERGTSKRPSAVEVLERLKIKTDNTYPTDRKIVAPLLDWKDLPKETIMQLAFKPQSQNGKEDQGLKNRWFTPFEKSPPEEHFVMGEYWDNASTNTRTSWYRKTMRIGSSWENESGDSIHAPGKWRYLTQQEMGAYRRARQSIVPVKDKDKTLRVDEKGGPLASASFASITFGILCQSVVTFVSPTPGNKIIISSADCLSLLMLPVSMVLLVMHLRRTHNDA